MKLYVHFSMCVCVFDGCSVDVCVCRMDDAAPTIRCCLFLCVFVLHSIFCIERKIHTFPFQEKQPPATHTVIGRFLLRVTWRIVNSSYPKLFEFESDAVNGTADATVAIQCFQIFLCCFSDGDVGRSSCFAVCVSLSLDRKFSQPNQQTE